MTSIKLDSSANHSIMESYSYYLIHSKKIPPTKARINVNIVRMIHNYVGKPYVDIEENDILCFLFYLEKKEHLSERSINKYLAAIKKFYNYLRNRGDINKLPNERINRKNLKNLISRKIDRAKK